ncbi:NlpC/P60 family protein [Bacillus carboniphilus]|uniref:NlpC/P60 family protein n=1 Tax=Bacillus carboniphilus TaxID=86663 RepID=A0ABY9JUK1_9BACI|nr:NlpC/P60 family protein [Bacillus carboniphilus]WLR42413.1 NlpC/P60 family protein [Bacillus carboniphilus]
MLKDTFLKIISEAEQYIGMKYVWGGSNPHTGFDCSGFTQWTFKKGGISLPRTAQKQYQQCTKIRTEYAKEGDLVFFTNTRKSKRVITHVGIYVGNNLMFDANRNGIGFTDVTTVYWKSRFVSFGRV